MFQPTEEQLMIRDLARDLAVREIGPRAAEVDESERYPEENIRLLAEAGILGAPFPEAYGGSDLGLMSFLMANEEVAKVCAATSCIIATNCLAVGCISRYGTEEQKRKYIPMGIGGQLIGFALTEANAGSDTNGLKTKAEKDGDDYIINGTKMFITSAPVNDVHIVVTVTGTNEKGGKEFTAFIIDKGTKGFSVGKHIKKMGIRGAQTAELILEDVRVSASQMLGGPGNGLKVALSSLDIGRINIGTQAMGIAQG
ncbi:MAG: acyl-CoA dehydrogenase family protein, partial [Lachnospiraceae bacterium]|nr:acyl-CoA dehydrogenase family protein [Lachnospiraceae bacterium]